MSEVMKWSGTNDNIPDPLPYFDEVEMEVLWSLYKRVEAELSLLNKERSALIEANDENNWPRIHAINRIYGYLENWLDGADDVIDFDYWIAHDKHYEAYLRYRATSWNGGQSAMGFMEWVEKMKPAVIELAAQQPQPEPAGGEADKDVWAMDIAELRMEIEQLAIANEELEAENKKLRLQAKMHLERVVVAEEKRNQERDNVMLLYRALSRNAPEVWVTVKDQLNGNINETDKLMSDATRGRLALAELAAAREALEHVEINLSAIQDYVFAPDAPSVNAADMTADERMHGMVSQAMDGLDVIAEALERKAQQPTPAQSGDGSVQG